MSELDFLLQSLRSEGQLDSEGSFTLDQKVSRKKWSEFSPPFPYQAICYALQLSHLWGSKVLDFSFHQTLLSRQSYLEITWDLDPQESLLRPEHQRNLFENPLGSQEGSPTDKLWTLMIFAFLNQSIQKIELPKGIIDAESDSYLSQKVPSLSSQHSSRSALKIRICYPRSARELFEKLQNQVSLHLPWLSFLNSSQITFNKKALKLEPHNLYGPLVKKRSWDVSWLYLGILPVGSDQKGYSLRKLFPQPQLFEHCHKTGEALLTTPAPTLGPPWIIDLLGPSKEAIDPGQHQGVLLGTGITTALSELILVKNGCALSRHIIPDNSKGLLLFLPFDEGKTDFSGLKMIQDEYFVKRIQPVYQLFDKADQTLLEHSSRLPSHRSSKTSIVRKLIYRSKNFFSSKQLTQERYHHDLLYPETKPEDLFSSLLQLLAEHLCPPAIFFGPQELIYRSQEPFSTMRQYLEIKGSSTSRSSYLITLALSLTPQSPLIEWSQIEQKLQNYHYEQETLEDKIAYLLRGYQMTRAGRLLIYYQRPCEHGLHQKVLELREHSYNFIELPVEKPYGMKEFSQTEHLLILNIDLSSLPLYTHRTQALKRLANLLSLSTSWTLFERQTPQLPLWRQTFWESRKKHQEFSRVQNTDLIPPLLAYATSSQEIKKKLYTPDWLPSIPTEIEKKAPQSAPIYHWHNYFWKMKNFHAPSQHPEILMPQLLFYGLGNDHGTSKLPVARPARYYFQTCDFERPFSVIFYYQGVTPLSWTPDILAPGLIALVALDQLYLRGFTAPWLFEQSQVLAQEVKELRQLMQQNHQHWQPLPARMSRSQRTQHLGKSILRGEPLQDILTKGFESLTGYQGSSPEHLQSYQDWLFHSLLFERSSSMSGPPGNKT